MLAVALGSLALASLVVLLAATRDRYQARAHDRERLSWDAERARIIDQLLHATGKPWSPPPIRTVERPEREPDPDREFARQWP